MNRDYLKSLKTPVLRGMWERLKKKLLGLPCSEIMQEDLDELIQMRDDLDSRSGKPTTDDIEFTDYLTD